MFCILDLNQPYQRGHDERLASIANACYLCNCPSRIVDSVCSVLKSNCDRPLRLAIIHFFNYNYPLRRESGYIERSNICSWEPFVTQLDGNIFQATLKGVYVLTMVPAQN